MNASYPGPLIFLATSVGSACEDLPHPRDTTSSVLFNPIFHSRSLHQQHLSAILVPVLSSCRHPLLVFIISCIPYPNSVPEVRAWLPVVHFLITQPTTPLWSLLHYLLISGRVWIRAVQKEDSLLQCISGQIH